MSAIGPVSRRTERIVLRSLGERDRRSFERMLEESVSAWEPWTPTRDPSLGPAEVFRRELARSKAAADAGTHLRLAAVTRSGDVVGLFALNEIVRGVFQSAHASWQVSAPWMGKGLGTEGARALVDIAFAPAPGGLGLHRVQANVMPENLASLRLAEKVGFRREGLARRYLRIAGAWRDHVMLAITADEWPREPSPER